MTHRAADVTSPDSAHPSSALRHSSAPPRRWPRRGVGFLAHWESDSISPVVRRRCDGPAAKWRPGSPHSRPDQTCHVPSTRARHHRSVSLARALLRIAHTPPVIALAARVHFPRCEDYPWWVPTATDISLRPPRECSAPTGWWGLIHLRLGAWPTVGKAGATDRPGARALGGSRL